MNDIFSKAARRVLVVVMAALGWFLVASDLRADALERLRLDRLAAVHDDIERLAAERRAVDRKTGYDDIRASLHVQMNCDSSTC